MCGRFVQIDGGKGMVEHLGIFSDVMDVSPRYNIAPSTSAMVIRHTHHGMSLALLQWGLIPHWAKDSNMRSRMINARSETAAEKLSFRAAFRQRRCLIPTDGFYEWKKAGRGKQPHFIRMANQKPFAMAGLWESWSSQGEPPLETFTILTTEPNDLMRPIHNRMPVIINPDHYRKWVDPRMQDTDTLAGMMVPYPETHMEAYPVAPYLNNPRNDSPLCMERYDDDSEFRLYPG